MLSQRSSGILLHPTSLPSRGGIGDFGPAAYEFVDWLAAAKQTLWQVLPLQPVGCGNSPYSCTSAFAGNVLLISLERLAESRLLDRAHLAGELGRRFARRFRRGARAYKLPLLHEAARNFLNSATAEMRARLRRLLPTQLDRWLDDYVLFSVLRERFDEQAWNHLAA